MRKRRARLRALPKFDGWQASSRRAAKMDERDAGWRPTLPFRVWREARDRRSALPTVHWLGRSQEPRVALVRRQAALDAIKALPIKDHLADDAHLYLWATNKSLPAAFEVVNAWGFTYSTTLVWAKNMMGGGLGGAYRISSEFVLFARRGKLRELETVRGTWFNWKRPYNAQGKPMHSAKPPEFYEMVETVSPGPRLELFARRPRDGWHVWGNEVASDVDIAA